jgi:hypothetical protein
MYFVLAVVALEVLHKMVTLVAVRVGVWGT